MSKYLELNKVTGSLFDLKKNNSTYSVILFSNEDIKTEVDQIFNKLLENDKLEFNYYVLQKYFSQLSYDDTNGVLKCIINAVENKINLIKEAINDNNGDVDLSIYTQLWNSYREYFRKIYLIVKNYQKYLLEKNIKTKIFKMNLFSIIEISMFYNGVISGKNDFFQQISKTIHNIDKNNVEQLINYVDSLELFSYVKDYLDNKSDVLETVNEIINKPNIINVLCFYLDKLLKSIVNRNNLLQDEDYCTINPEKVKNKILRKVYKIVNILTYHSARNVLFLHYLKYFKARIYDNHYNNNKLEIQIIKKLSICLGKEYSQKLIDMIQSIDANNTHNKNIQNAIVKIVSGEFESEEINSKIKILNPVVIPKKCWDIPNITLTNINYPTEIACCFQIISKYYENYYQNFEKNNITIDWQPTLGCVEYKAKLGNKEVTITCNLLQAMLISHLNENEIVTVIDFSKKYNIPEKLSKKIFKSLFEDNILIKINTDSSEIDKYTVNNKNYTGDQDIKSWKTFVEVFEKENIEVSQNDTVEDTKPINTSTNVDDFDSDEEVPVIIDDDAMDAVKLSVKICSKNDKKSDLDLENEFKKIDNDLVLDLDSDSDSDSDSNYELEVASNNKIGTKVIDTDSEDEPKNNNDQDLYSASESDLDSDDY
ncbi:culin-like protein [Moumouvirus maliensis]|nr:culin-like protein [Moumouvirus maliensis]